MYSLHVRVWRSIGFRPLTLDEWIFDGSIALLVADNVEAPTEDDFTRAESVERSIFFGNEVAAQQEAVKFLTTERSRVGGHTWHIQHSSTIRLTNTSTVSSAR